MAQAKPVQLNLFRPIDYVQMGKGLDVLHNSLNAHFIKADTMIRYAAISADEVFKTFDMSGTAADNAQDISTTMFNIKVKVNIKRIHTFKNNCMCTGCGRVGNTFVIERHKNNDEESRQLNLYSVTDKDMVLMTVDHILPDSLAGKYSIKNFQTMCSKCNQKKKNHMSLSEIAKVRAHIHTHVKSWAYVPYIHLLLDMQEKLACTRDPAVLSKWRHKLNEALKHLDAKKAAPKHMKSRTEWLQKTIDALNGIQPVPPVAKPVVNKPVAPVPTLTQQVMKRAGNYLRRLRAVRIEVRTA